MIVYDNEFKYRLNKLKDGILQFIEIKCIKIDNTLPAQYKCPGEYTI